MDNFNYRKFVYDQSLTKDEDTKQTLNENAPGYDTRKFGEALPTLESVKAAHEAKEEVMSDKDKDKEPRDGVKSAASKLGMKPSHIKEANVGLDDLQDIGYDDGEYAVKMHFNKDVNNINNELDYKYYRRGFLEGVKDSTASYKLEENMYIDDDEFNKEMGRSKKDSLRKEMMMHVDQLMDGNIDMIDFMNVVEEIMLDVKIAAKDEELNKRQK